MEGLKLKKSTKRSTMSTGEKGLKQEPNKRKQQKKNMNDQQIKKTYLKSRNACKVTFRVSKEAVPDAHQVCVAGDFNEWNILANPMKRLKNGDFTTQIELPPGRDYQFRYHIDDTRWENDWQADKYVPNPFGDSDNSVVVV
jgi:1,4-alpha-glucan branching enzyme